MEKGYCTRWGSNNYASIVTMGAPPCGFFVPAWHLSHKVRTPKHALRKELCKAAVSGGQEAPAASVVTAWWSAVPSGLRCVEKVQRLIVFKGSRTDLKHMKLEMATFAFQMANLKIMQARRIEQRE